MDHNLPLNAYYRVSNNELTFLRGVVGTLQSNETHRLTSRTRQYVVFYIVWPLDKAKMTTLVRLDCLRQIGKDEELPEEGL